MVKPLTVNEVVVGSSPIVHPKILALVPCSFTIWFYVLLLFGVMTAQGFYIPLAEV